MNRRECGIKILDRFPKNGDILFGKGICDQYFAVEDVHRPQNIGYHTELGKEHNFLFVQSSANNGKFKFYSCM
jgi:hypothetical protein